MECDTENEWEEERGRKRRNTKISYKLFKKNLWFIDFLRKGKISSSYLRFFSKKYHKNEQIRHSKHVILEKKSFKKPIKTLKVRTFSFSFCI